jgi:hypothetical protein
MNVNDAFVAVGQKFLLIGKFDHSNDSFELQWLQTVIHVVTNNVSSLNFIFLQSFNSQLYIFSCDRIGKFLIFGVENFLNFKLFSLR